MLQRNNTIWQWSLWSRNTHINICRYIYMCERTLFCMRKTDQAGKVPAIKHDTLYHGVGDRMLGEAKGRTSVWTLMTVGGVFRPCCWRYSCHKCRFLFDTEKPPRCPWARTCCSWELPASILTCCVRWAILAKPAIRKAELEHQLCSQATCDKPWLIEPTCQPLTDDR